MRKLLLVSCAGFAAVGVLAGSAIASRSAAAFVVPRLTCSGTLLVDVSARILNEADAGVLGNVWALDAITERARVWQTTAPVAVGSPGGYCVVESSSGSFATFAGPSPEGTGAVTAGVRGLLASVQRFEVAAIFRPLVPLSGFLGTFDFGCNQQGVCPGNVRFSSLFFQQITGVSGAGLASVYVAGQHGTWIQTSSGDFGDITG
jgi:hypothetical protein